MKVSVLLLTYNEARNLPRCLDALAGWCDDIVTVDSGSTDATLEIARERGVRILERPFDNFANQRNFGLEKGDFPNEWVLHLDADEVVTPAFRARLDGFEAPAGIDGFRVPSMLMLHGRWLRRAGMYPTYQVRLGHAERLRFRQVGHGQREDLPPERVGTFDEPYEHYNFSQGLSAWITKHARYAADEAAEMLAAEDHGRDGVVAGLRAGGTERRRSLKRIAGGLPPVLRPLARFVYVWLWRRGFLDGRAGLLYALMLAVYEGMIAIHLMDARLRRAERPVARAQTRSRHEDLAA